MKSRAEIERLEKLIGQLSGLHAEISLLAKRSPNDAVNSFKLGLINNVLKSANLALAPNYLPLAGFDSFSSDDLPSNSDVTLVLSQYLEEVERYRSDNVGILGGRWYYMLGDKHSDVPAATPAKVIKK